MHLKVIWGKAKLEHTLSLLGYNKINTRVVERHNGTSFAEASMWSRM